MAAAAVVVEEEEEILEVREETTTAKERQDIAIEEERESVLIVGNMESTVRDMAVDEEKNNSRMIALSSIMDRHGDPKAMEKGANQSLVRSVTIK